MVRATGCAVCVLRFSEPPQGFHAGTYGSTLEEVPLDLRKLKVPLDHSPIGVLQISMGPWRCFALRRLSRAKGALGSKGDFGYTRRGKWVTAGFHWLNLFLLGPAFMGGTCFEMDFRWESGVQLSDPWKQVVSSWLIPRKPGLGPFERIVGFWA
ncbi:hypothetical protein U1Q18_003322 [Sarracenia purpurea var. burkii]